MFSFGIIIILVVLIALVLSIYAFVKKDSFGDLPTDCIGKNPVMTPTGICPKASFPYVYKYNSANNTCAIELVESMKPYCNEGSYFMIINKKGGCYSENKIDEVNCKKLAQSDPNYVWYNGKCMINDIVSGGWPLCHHEEVYDYSGDKNLCVLKVLSATPYSCKSPVSDFHPIMVDGTPLCCCNNVVNGKCMDDSV